MYAPMGKVWHAWIEALSCIRDHGETLPQALRYAREEFLLTPQEEDEVRLRVLVELEAPYGGRME